MAERIGTPLQGPVRIKSTLTPKPIAYSNEIAGGPWNVNTIAERNAIQSYYRTDDAGNPLWGSTCYVHSDPNPDNNGRWELARGLVDSNINNNDNWQKIAAGATSIAASVVKQLYESNNNTNAFTDQEKSKLAAQTGINTGDETPASVRSKYLQNSNTREFTVADKNKLDLQSGSNTGDETDQSILGKLLNNDNVNVLTDAEKQRLNDIQGVNTGDETPETVLTKFLANENTEQFTTEHRSKLEGLEDSKFRGKFTSLTELQTAYPVGQPGWNAYVDAGVGNPIVEYIWDDTDDAWELQEGTATAETPESIKTKYESNVNTNAYDDASKTKVDNLSGVNTGDETPGSIKSKLLQNPDTNNYSDDEKDKLEGIQPGATVNSPDAFLRDRENHTGEQAISTISGLQAILDGILSLNAETFITTQPGANAAQNGVDLIAAYNSLKSFTPGGEPLSETNQVFLLAMPGRYKLPTTNQPPYTSLVIAEFVNIIGFGSKEATIIEGEEGNLLLLVPENVNVNTIENLTFRGGNNVWIEFASTNSDKQIFRNIILDNVLISNSGSNTLGGLYENISKINSDSFIFGGAQNTITGRFINIEGGFATPDFGVTNGYYERCNLGETTLLEDAEIVNCSVDLGLYASIYIYGATLYNCKFKSDSTLENYFPVRVAEGSTFGYCTFEKTDGLGMIDSDNEQPINASFHHCHLISGTISSNITNLIPNGHNSWDVSEGGGGTDHTAEITALQEGKLDKYISVPNTFEPGDVLGFDSNGDFAIAGTDIEMFSLVVQEGKAILPGQSYDLGLPVGGYFYNETTQELTLTQPTAEGEVVRPAYIQGNGFGVFLYSQGYQMAGELDISFEEGTEY